MRERTAAELRYFAANDRFYLLEWLIYRFRQVPSASSHVVRHILYAKDIEALQRAARKVALAEVDAPWLASDCNPLIVEARAELRRRAA